MRVLYYGVSGHVHVGRTWESGNPQVADSVMST